MKQKPLTFIVGLIVFVAIGGFTIRAVAGACHKLCDSTQDTADQGCNLPCFSAAVCVLIDWTDGYFVGGECTREGDTEDDCNTDELTLDATRTWGACDPNTCHCIPTGTSISGEVTDDFCWVDKSCG